MKLKGRRQSTNVKILPKNKKVKKNGKTYTQIQSTKDHLRDAIDKVVPGSRSRQQLKDVKAEMTGRAMGFGKQLDAIEKSGKNAKGPYEPDTPTWPARSKTSSRKSKKK